ncbi:MAG TPA: tetraacyldisaccharide 4'-kinase [bacterium]|nr:tetraacyldisaccharide 4'-kinase [bacterium]HOL47569.1 tetraacyldisaccharide 4'-kinase [bacterium]HPQ18831.1 tetraacyldisaccharide 4'-kinase [bacterium]
MDTKIKRKFILFLVDFIAWKILKFVYRSIKFQIVNLEVVTKNPRYILSFFHRHLLIPLWVLKNRKIKVIISEHFDGEIIARIVLKSGNLTVRGSSTRGYIKVIKEILKIINEYNIAITPDGPSGPIYHIYDGLIYLAQKSGLPIIGVAGNFEDKIIINNWDNFIIPIPYTNSYVELSEPIYYNNNLSFEENKKNISKILLELAEKTSLYFPIKRKIEIWQTLRKKYYQLFLFFSILYLSFIKIKNILYDLKILKKIKFKNLKIILVGNISVGGTGKSQYVEHYIKENLQNQQVIILSSGYKSKYKDFEIVKFDDVKKYGDEPLMLKKNLPDVIVIVAKNRLRMLKILNENFKNYYVILDDAFHYQRINADKNILIIDISKDIIKEKILPVGILREPLKSIKRADKIVLNKINYVSEEKINNIITKLYKINNRAEYERIIYKIDKIYNSKNEEKKIEDLQNKKICLFCGIGNPEFFYEFVKEECKININKKLFFDDHTNYNIDEIAHLKLAAKENELMITTEKDFIKIKTNKFAEEFMEKIIIIKAKMKTERIER